MRVSKLAPSDKVQGRWLCHMEDGSILRVTEGEVVSFGLHSGMELDGELRAALDAAVEKGTVRERALGLIARRPLSRKELLDKLTARPRDKGKPPADPAAAEEAADWLEELGYLDDEAYARTVARHYSAKGYGEGKIRDELWKRGVPRDFWDGAIEESEAPEEGIDALIRRKLKGGAPGPQELKRVSDALARRGYRWEDIKAGLRRYGADIAEE